MEDDKPGNGAEGGEEMLLYHHLQGIRSHLGGQQDQNECFFPRILSAGSAERRQVCGSPQSRCAPGSCKHALNNAGARITFGLLSQAFPVDFC